MNIRELHLRSLYGSHFYLVPPKAQAEPTPEAPLTDASHQTTGAPALVQPRLAPVAWDRSQARLAILTAATEYADAPLRELLGKMVAALGLSPDAVAYAMVVPPVAAVALAAPAPHLMVLGELLAGEPQGITVHHLPPLATLQLDMQAKRAAWEQMKSFKDQL